MAIQKEPGQKGVNWSNIAVGMYVFYFLTRLLTCNEGGIMNMVRISLRTLVSAKILFLLLSMINSVCMCSYSPSPGRRLTVTLEYLGGIYLR